MLPDGRARTFLHVTTNPRAPEPWLRAPS